ncbi:hypothetical protein K2P97_10120 [bacterium]|nr:hypothetical protein [bacterium]
MTAVYAKNRITFLSGRPSSGKTRTAIETCSELLSKNWHIIYYHAEGALGSSPSVYGARNPDQLQKIHLVLDGYFNLDDLTALITNLSKNKDSTGILVVIDYLELFDCEPSDFLHAIKCFNSIDNLHFFILTQIPRYLERKTKDHAEEYIRKTYPTELVHQIKILGNFEDDD